MQRQEVIVSVAYCITFCGQSKQRFWLLISNEDGGKSTRQQAERKKDRERERTAGEEEREGAAVASSSGPWSPSGQTDRRTWPLGHAGQKRDNLQSSWDALLCSQLCSLVWSALFWSIWNTEKKVQAIWTFWPKSMEISIAHGGNRGKPRGQVAWGMRQPLNRAFHSSHMVSPSPPSLFLSLLATELPQKRFLILILQDSPWSIIIIRRASQADLCISRRSRRSSWVHANVNECIWILVRFSTSANTACKWMRIQVDNRIDVIFFKRFNWIG